MSGFIGKISQEGVTVENSASYCICVTELSFSIVEFHCNTGSNYRLLHFNNFRSVDSSFSSHLFFNLFNQPYSQLAFTCSKLTIEALEQGVKYVQS